MRVMQKRRALVLVDEAARHPFLRSLPPHVRQPQSGEAAPRSWWRLGSADLRDFLGAYCATFVAVAIFIS